MFLYLQKEGNNMNLIFKKIWSRSLGCCVVVSENTKSSGKVSQVTGSLQQPLKITGNIQLSLMVVAGNWQPATTIKDNGQYPAI